MLSTVIQWSSYGDVINSWGGGGGGTQNLYVEAPFRGPNPYPFKYFSLQKPLKYLDELAVGCLCSRYFENLFLYLNDSFPSPFLYFSSWSPYPFIYLQPEKGTPFKQSLSVQSIKGNAPPGGLTTRIIVVW